MKNCANIVLGFGMVGKKKSSGRKLIIEHKMETDTKWVGSSKIIWREIFVAGTVGNSWQILTIDVHLGVIIHVRIDGNSLVAWNSNSMELNSQTSWRQDKMNFSWNSSSSSFLFLFTLFLSFFFWFFSNHFSFHFLVFFFFWFFYFWRNRFRFDVFLPILPRRITEEV